MTDRVHIDSDLPQRWTPSCSCFYVCVCVCSQEDACSHEQEEGVLHQIGVSPGQWGQVGIVFFQFFHPALPCLEHRFELAEGAARRGGRYTEDRRKSECIKLLTQNS